MEGIDLLIRVAGVLYVVLFLFGFVLGGLFANRKKNSLGRIESKTSKLSSKH